MRRRLGKGMCLRGKDVGKDRRKEKDGKTKKAWMDHSARYIVKIAAQDQGTGKADCKKELQHTFFSRDNFSGPNNSCQMILKRIKVKISTTSDHACPNQWDHGHHLSFKVIIQAKYIHHC